MFGIVIGTLCLLGLIAVLRHGRRWHPGHGYGGYGVNGARFWLRAAFARLGTSPSQEKVIVEAANDLRDQGGKVWTEWQQSRADLAEALRAEPLDNARVQAAFARHDGLMAELRKVSVDALGKVHGVLDPAQRRTLASMIERHGFGLHHGCASSCGC